MEINNSNQEPVNRTTTIRCVNDNKLVAEGDVIRFSDVVEALCPNTTRQIDVFATSKVLIDANFTINDNCQLNIVAPNWEVIGSQKIVLDGKTGEPHSFQKAKDGEPGLPGLPGGPAGYFYGIGVNFVNCENLTISANGGAGGPGQDGGNGIPGQPGEDANPDLILETEHHRKFAGKEMQTYLVQGISGRKGGDGGDGGKGGLGGPGGEVKIWNLGEIKNHGISIFNSDGQNGPNGKEGPAGPGGKNGKDCRIVVSEKYAVWVEYGKNKNVTCFETNKIAAAGNDGKPGANQNGQRLNFGHVFQPLSEILLDYKIFALKNLPESREFLKTILKRYDPSYMAQELQMLEKEEASKSIYEYLLDQFYEYIENENSEIDDDVLTQVYFAIKSKLNLLQQRNQNYFIFDPNKYLKEVVKRLKSLKNTQRRPSRNLWFNDNDYLSLKKVKEDLNEANQTEFSYVFAKTYVRGLLSLDPHIMKPLLETNKFKKTLESLKKIVEDFQRSKDPLFVDFFQTSPNWISLVKLNNWMKNNFNTDIYSRIQSFEDQMMLGQVLLKNSKISRIIKVNVILNQYQMAEMVVKQTKFPVLHIFSQKDDLPSLDDRDNLDRLISNSIKRIEELDPFIDLDYTYHGVEGDKYSTYVWNHQQWKSQINELLSGKEVSLTADVSDDQNIKLLINLDAVKLEEVGIKLVTYDKNQKQLDEILKNFKVRMTHAGDSYYRCGNHTYVIFGDEQVFEFGYNNSYKNEAWEKLKKSTPFLSPYTTWGVRLLVKSNSDFDRLEDFKNHVNVQLIGDIRGFRKNIKKCQDDNSKILKKHFTVASNITQSEKNHRGRKKRNAFIGSHFDKGRSNVDEEVVNDFLIESNKWAGFDNAIDYKNPKGSAIFTPGVASFDLNSNLMLGQLFMSKMFGRFVRRRTYLTPEQKRLIRVKELEDHILPFLH